MNIPANVKVAGYIYDIERPESSFLEDGAVLDGVHIPSEQLIRVVRSGTEDFQNTIFLHELLHAIIYAFTPDKQDEELVEQLAKGLYQVIVDNPEIFVNKGD